MRTSTIILGVILFVAGLVSIIMRGEITVKIVGRGQIVHDAFFGGGDTGTTLTAIMVIGSIAMIIGLILLVIEILKATGQKAN